MTKLVISQAALDVIDRACPCGGQFFVWQSWDVTTEVGRRAGGQEVPLPFVVIELKCRRCHDKRRVSLTATA